MHCPQPTPWLPPLADCVKWNVDASLNPLISKSDIGGVLRGIDGEFICLFSSPIPFMEINHAELLPIHKAIKILLHSNRMNCSNVIVKSDLLNAVKWCNGACDGPWNLNFIIKFIRGVVHSFPGFSITYKSQKSNVVADSLAKQGLRRDDDFVAWL